MGESKEGTGAGILRLSGGLLVAGGVGAAAAAARRYVDSSWRFRGT